MNSRPWLQHYDAGVPQSLSPYPRRTLLDEVEQAALERPNHPMLLFKGARFSYREIACLSDAFAAALVALGVAKGERVALLLPNCPQTIIAQLGAWKAGAVVAPINPTYPVSELEYALRETGAETAVVLTPFYEKVKAIQPRLPLSRVIAANIKEFLPTLQHFAFVLFKEKKDGHQVALQPGDVWFCDLLSEFADASRPPVPISPDDPALLMFTGGTTGRPKAALGTHQAVWTSGRQFNAWLEGIVAHWDDIILCNMPLFHAYAQTGLLTAGLIGRQPLALIPNPRDLDDLVATIGKVHPAFLPGVPTLFVALLKHPKIASGKVDLRSIKVCFSGAAPLMAETKQRFEALTGARILEAYGLTETMTSTSLHPAVGPCKPGSVGLPLPDVEVRIVDAEVGETDLPAGAVGEIIIRGPQLMTGYWGRPDETAEVLRDGWLFTGDLGYLDEDGFLFVVDRKKDLIKVSGFQVWPREIEEVLAAHPDVAEVGVAGVPDAYQGEAVRAWVVLRPNRQATAEELRAYCRERMVAYKVPKQVELLESLPKSAVGKVLRRELSAAEASRA